eukprot:GFUD01028453.1.p1 GENE.GFUD01028453.1~~GFUD01028453.1.p1  ORF type:complete len:759 (+),score=230.31 GFUD01028453.1:82-2358(+)
MSGCRKRRRGSVSSEAGLVEEDVNEDVVDTGVLDTISQQYESLDYDTNFNSLLLDEIRIRGYKFVMQKDIQRWLIMLSVGILTALVACSIDITIEVLAKIKYGWLREWTDHCVAEENNCLYIPYLMWVGLNVIPVTLGSFLVAYIEPVAGGSGIPQIKCYLNGVKVPRVVRIKTLICKAVGVTLSVLGGLAVGKEGPMIHSGAVIAAGISQGKSTSLNIDTKSLPFFRQDREKRDFVSGGAAAGVAAAFGSPVGGVLFALEEGASFWNQSLTWRIFFGSMTSFFTLNMVLSVFKGIPGQLSNGGLLNFGQFDDAKYEVWELPLFVLMGIIGGVLGALYNHINFKLTVFRMRYITSPALKMLEVMIVAAVTATAGFLMIYLISDCKPFGNDPTDNPIQMYCNDGEYHVIGAIWFQTPEQSVRSLLHDPPSSHHLSTLGIFFMVYFLLNCWTYGLSVSSGVFIPTLLAGAAWGRFAGAALETIFPNSGLGDPGKYALLGAAAMLGGVVRMTISLTVILIEATGNLTYGFPIMVVLMVAKWVGDYFNEGLYDIHIQLAGVPLLAWEPPPLSATTYASEVMSNQVVALSPIETVGHIVDILKTTTHNGFPVVDHPMELTDNGRSFGKLRGLILRSELIVLLQHKIFSELYGEWEGKVDMALFRMAYPRYPDISRIYVSTTERDYHMDLRPVMNTTPTTILHSTSMPQMFNLFRALGLRHMLVLNDNNEVVGMVTRKDLARFRVVHQGGSMAREMVHVTEEVQ